MTLVRDAGAKAVAQFTVPYKGTWQSIAVHQLPVDALYSSNNVFLRQGKLRRRPALVPLTGNNTVFDDAIIGGGIAISAHPSVINTLCAITRVNCYELSTVSPTWGLTSAGDYAVSDGAVIDMAFTQTGGNTVGLVASPNRQLKKWQPGLGLSDITPVTGVVPTASSVCVASRRVIALIEPSTLVWTTVLTYDNWPALAIANVSSTGDKGICIKTLSNLSFVLYKERSIYLARAQAGSDAAAFAIAEPIKVEGPAGIRAVVDVAGAHMYMTRSGRIGIYDGSTYPQWIADGVWLYLQGDIDSIYAYKIFGVYDYRLHTVTFFYPRLGDSGLCKGMVLINLPFQGQVVTEQGTALQTSPAAFLGQCGIACSHGYDIRLPIGTEYEQSLFFTVDPNRDVVYRLNGNSDSGNIYQCSMQTGLVALPDMMHYQLSVELFIERANGNGGVKLSPVVSDVLDTVGGTVVTEYTQIVDINNNPVREYIGFNTPTRFFGLQYTWDSTSNVQYAGAIVYGRLVS